MKILYCQTDEIEPDCFAVYASLGNGELLYHEGPTDYAYFTREQAEKLANRVSAAGKIDPKHWDDGRIFADDNQREQASLEDKYWERYEQ